MIRELLVSSYLFVFSIVFSIFKLFPQKERFLFVSYLGFNVQAVVEYMEKNTNEEIVIVKTKHTLADFGDNTTKVVLDTPKGNLYKWLRFVYFLATSNKVVVDNYYAFLSVTKFKEGTSCVQLWHAAGALKKFGLQDISIASRSKSANKRFRQVYNRFDHVVVGSDKMATVFQECFGLSKDKMIKTGIPRTDFFFNDNEMLSVKENLYAQYPETKDKTVILYAPTFRDGEFEVSEFPLDIQEMRSTLGEDHVLLIKTHPLVNNNALNDYTDFVINVSDYKNTNHLLSITDILISDYSSIPFEFSFFEKPMIFFAYDLEEYSRERGLWSDYKEIVPGVLAYTTNDIIQAIKSNDFSFKKTRNFKEEWNTYSDGHASEKLYHFLQSKNK